MRVINMFIIIKIMVYSKTLHLSKFNNYMKKLINLVIIKLTKLKKISLWLKGFQNSFRNWKNTLLRSRILSTRNLSKMEISMVLTWLRFLPKWELLSRLQMINLWLEEGILWLFKNFTTNTRDQLSSILQFFQSTTKDK